MSKRPQAPFWFQDWSRDVVVIIASGPSATTHGDLDQKLRKKAKVIAVNSSYKLVKWPHLIFATDHKWWELNRQIRDANWGQKVTVDRGAANPKFPHLFFIKVVEQVALRYTLLFEPLGIIGSGGNSGFQALNLAVQFGARRIILVGFDCSLKEGVHWHGKHGQGLMNPSHKQVERWRLTLDSQAEELQRRGVEVINCSPTSTLQNYTRLPLDIALWRWAGNREEVAYSYKREAVNLEARS